MVAAKSLPSKLRSNYNCSVARHAPFNPPSNLIDQPEKNLRIYWLTPGEVDIHLLYCEPKAKEGYDNKGPGDQFCPHTAFQCLNLYEIPSILYRIPPSNIPYVK